MTLKSKLLAVSAGCRVTLRLHCRIETLLWGSILVLQLLETCICTSTALRLRYRVESLLSSKLILMGKLTYVACSIALGCSIRLGLCYSIALSLRYSIVLSCGINCRLLLNGVDNSPVLNLSTRSGISLRQGGIERLLLSCVDGL